MKRRDMEDIILKFVADKQQATKYEISKALKIPYSTVATIVEVLCARHRLKEQIGERTRAGLRKKNYRIGPEGLSHLLYFRVKDLTTFNQYLKEYEEMIPYNWIIPKIKKMELSHQKHVVECLFSISMLEPPKEDSEGAWEKLVFDDLFGGVCNDLCNMHFEDRSIISELIGILMSKLKGMFTSSVAKRVLRHSVKYEMSRLQTEEELVRKLKQIA